MKSIYLEIIRDAMSLAKSYNKYEKGEAKTKSFCNAKRKFSNKLRKYLEDIRNGVVIMNKYTE